MVGVPRSRGCQICRSIKKGCDLRQPSCSRCERLQLSCIYVGKQWRFITDVATVQASPVPSEGSSSASRSVVSTDSNGDLGFTALSLQRASVIEGLVDSCLSVFMPTRTAYSKHPVGDAFHAPSASELRLLASTPRSALQTALRAWTCALLGVHRNDTVLLTHGTRLYASSLRTINRDLQHPVHCRSDATLTACYYLALYEWFRRDATTRVTSQSSDWVSHVAGTCRMIEIRQADDHASAVGSALFANARQSAMTAGMQQRQSVMASDIWRTARLPPEQGCINPRDSLLDTMMNIPELLQRHDLLKQRCNLVSNGLGDQDRSSLLDDGECLLRDCSTTVEALRGWEMRTLEHLVASASHDVDPPTTLRQICKDYGYGFFHTVMYYWTGSILLKGQMWFTFALLSRLRLTAELSEHPKPSLPPNIDPREDAENIAANIMHYFESEAGLWGAQIAAFPLGAALHFFIVTEGSSSPSKQRLIATVGESSKAAYTLAFLASAAAETVPPDIRGDAADGKTHAGMASRWFSGESKAVTEVSSEAP